jgi:hypothetical protein
MDEGSSEPDILEQQGKSRLLRLPSPGWRPPPGAGVLAAVTLVVGLAAGSAVGYGHRRGSAATPAKASSPTAQMPTAAPQASTETAPSAYAGFLGPALTQDSGTCSVQAGRDLELGIPVTNQSTETILLQSARPVSVMPEMLTVRSWRWGPCGFEGNAIAPDTVALGPGQTTWVTAVVHPLIACPAPVPVQFRVTYSVNRQPGSSSLPGFADLSEVRYSGCPASAA